MKKVALTLMTAALLGACSNRDEAGTTADSAGAMSGAAIQPGAGDTAGGMTDTTMGGTTGTGGTGTAGAAAGTTGGTAGGTTGAGGTGGTGTGGTGTGGTGGTGTGTGTDTTRDSTRAGGTGTRPPR